MPLKAVIFDVDGTLVDSNPLHVEAWRDAFLHYGKDIPREALHAQMGKGGDQLMPVFLTPGELERYGAELARMRVNLFIEKYLPRARPFPRVRELFERLHRDGKRLVVASSAKEAELRHHLRNCGIESFVEAATSADSAEHTKPCPDIFRAALGRLGDVPPAQALAIGDTPYDVQAAGKAGLRTIGVLTGSFAEETLYAAGAIAVYRDLGHLLARYEASPLRT
jgi:HAD superfamily hydrolase (TIGR01509 family)